MSPPRLGPSRSSPVAGAPRTGVFALPDYKPSPPPPGRPRSKGPKYQGGKPPAPTRVHDPEEAAFHRGPGKVLGKDDRVPVPSPVAAPFRHVCALEIMDSATPQRRWLGTGWLVAPRAVVTAGHCLHLHDRGGLVRSVRVLPAFQRGVAPYGEETASAPRSFEVHEAWARDRDERFDFGVIFLARGFPACGSFGFAAAPDALILKEPLNVSGYPRDIEEGQYPYFHGRFASAIDDHLLRYETDTFSGQSGSPVWIEHNHTTYAVGIHTYGGEAFNQAVRIHPDVFRRILDWKRRGSA